MNKRTSVLSILSFIFSLTGIPGAGFAEPGASQALERSQRAFDYELASQERRDTHDWLISEHVAEAMANAISVPVSEDEKLDIDTARGERPVRVGLTKSLANDFFFSDVNLRGLRGQTLVRTDGALKATEDGGYVFTAVLSSPDAAGIRVKFTGFRLPDDAELYLYTDDGQVFGPYTGRGPFDDGEFWSHTLVGDQVMLQLRHYSTPSNADLASTSFRISGIGHLRPRFLGGACTYNAPCIKNLACETSVHAAVNDAKNAVAHMQWITGAFINFCTGGLLADTDPNSHIPYFLTANHCISRSKDAKSLETFFLLDDRTDTVDVDCDNMNQMTCDDWRNHRADHPQSLRTLGATIKATNDTSDYTLLELNQLAPVGTAFLGWDAMTDVANVDGSYLYRISHPSAAPQSYSEHIVDTSKGTCAVWPRGDWIYSRDSYGATEGGSSGSPVVNSDGQVVGQLSGACGLNPGNSCDTNNATVDGAFAAYFGEVEQFLDPVPATCAPTFASEICGDGIDNNCDGLTDAEDAACPSDSIVYRVPAVEVSAQHAFASNRRWQ
jgi:hypothetical protein